MNNFRENIHWDSLLENSVPTIKVPRISDNAHLPEISEEMTGLLKERRKRKNLKKKKIWEENKSFEFVKKNVTPEYFKILSIVSWLINWGIFHWQFNSISNYLAVCPLEIILEITMYSLEYSSLVSFLFSLFFPSVSYILGRKFIETFLRFSHVFYFAHMCDILSCCMSFLLAVWKWEEVLDVWAGPRVLFMIWSIKHLQVVLYFLSLSIYVESAIFFLRVNVLLFKNHNKQ